jgi:2'-5' RNA ligase
MKRRIFIAINLPQEIKKALASYRNKHPDLPARWTAPENMHITLEFLGYLTEQETEEVKRFISKTAKEHKQFLINLNNIHYAPLNVLPPRMIWLAGEAIDEFTSLKKYLQKSLSSKISFIPEKRTTSLHVTLARIKEWEWRRIEPEERPEIKENVDFRIKAESIDLMESVLKRSGPEYVILESYKLKP